MAITGTCAPTDPRHYVWWFPGSPIRVHVDLRVIEGLQKRLGDTGRGKAGRGVAGQGIAEQGLLFGRAREGATEILEFQPASNRTVPEMIAELSAEPGKRLLVGYYRTEHGDMLHLNEDDLSLFKMFFGKPHHVFLMIQPTAFAPPNATFFFSRGDHKMSEFPFLEFPLDASLLGTEERDRIARCQQATEGSIAAQPSLPPESGNVRTGGGVLLKISAGMLVAVFLLAALWIGTLLFGKRSPRVWSAIGKPQPAAEPSLSSSSHSSSRIGLQARRQDRDLELTWDRESPWIVAATSALISIEDGSVKRQIPLNSQQLRGESILYSPKSDQVLIQLKVTAPTGVTTESVRVIQNKVIPTYSATVSRPADGSRELHQGPSENIPLAQISKPFTAPPITKQTPSLTPLNEPPALPSNPDHPASPVAGFAVPQTLAPLRPMARPATLPPPIPEASPAVLTPASSDLITARDASTTATYHPPVPLTKVTPTFPPQLKSLVLKPTIVAVRVTIDKNGRVLKAEALPQDNIHRFFVVEAVHAAELWKFQPARRGDEPVPSESVLQFAFRQ